MTRINVVDPKELSTKHLIAEYREIARMPGYLRRSLESGSMDIPPEYVLGTGHVKFFYDKMLYLEKRFISLVSEMNRRGYIANYSDPTIFSNCDKRFYNDWQPDYKAIELNRKRILERS